MRSSLNYLFIALLLVSNVEAVVLEAVQDSYVQSGTDSGNNFNENTYLRVAARGGSFNRKAYLEFNLTGQFSANEVAANAAFSLTTKNAGGDPLTGSATGDVTFNVYGITDADDSWNETTVTWDVAPKNDGSNGGVSAEGTTFLGAFTIDSTTIVADVQYTVTGQAMDQYLNWASGASGDFYGTGVTQDLSPTLIITSAGLNTDPGVEFWNHETTGESSRFPQLSFDVAAAVPEVRTYALLLGVFAMGSVLARKR